MVINIKTIGIIIRSFEENNKYFIGTREDLFSIFYKYNINIIGIPINNHYENVIEVINLCDGVILSGGDNFIENDYLLVKYLYENNIPTLGICLGMQNMGKYFSKKEEINVSNHMSNEKYVHYINIDKNSLLFKIIKKEKILVNSRHKSAIEDTSLDIVAYSLDGVIEAVEDKNKTFFIGVEWHPESYNDLNSTRLFDYFVNVVNKNN